MNDQNDAILTLEECGEILKLSKSQIYSLTRSRGVARADVPFPVIRLHSKALRVKRSSLMQWIDAIAAQGRG
jgi:predicted DNA-binding transcriptional regulator AlpA